jgi:segregation and condensation protein A
MGVTVTFMAILELVREGLLDLVQAEPYGPLHVRGANRPPVQAVPDADPVTDPDTDTDTDPVADPGEGSAAGSP